MPTTSRKVTKVASAKAVGRAISRTSGTLRVSRSTAGKVVNRSAASGRFIGRPGK